MSGNIEKSSIILQKEQNLADLRKSKKKVITQLKRNKTSLTKLKEEALNLQRNIGGRMQGLMADMMELKSEIGKLLKAVWESDKIAAEDKEGLDEVLEVFDDMDDELEEMIGMSWEEFKQQRSEPQFNTDEFNRQRAQDMFQDFAVEVEETDQKTLRKTYVKLAARFHPDKAKSAKEKDQFHALMQQIVSAYERGDVQELLSMESKYADVQTLADLDVQHEGAIVDFLDTEIDKVQREIDMLQKQLERVKKEVKNIRRSELGDMIKVQKDARKYGYGTIEDQVEEMDEEIKNLSEVRDGLKEFLETGVMPESVREAFIAPEMEEFGLEDLVFATDGEGEEMEISMDDLLNLFGQMFEEEAPAPKRKRRRRKK